MKKQGRLSLLEFILLIHGTQMGIGILQLPRELAEKAGTDGWMALLFGWLLSTAASLVIVLVMKTFPGGTMIELIGHYFGKWAEKAAALVFAVSYGFLTGIVMFRAILFIKAFILPRTDDYLLFLLFAVPTYSILRHDVRVLGRYSVVAFLVLLWMPFFYLFALKDSHWLYLLPLFKEGLKPVFQALPSTAASYIGFEIVFLLYPFLQKQEKAYVGVIAANTLTMLVYTSITIICFTFFSPEGILETNEPTLSILKVIEFHFMERLEVVFLAFYLFIVSTTWMPCLYWSMYATQKLIGLKQPSAVPLTLFLLATAVLLVFYHPNFNENDKLQKVYGQINYVLAYAMPLCLGGYLLVRRAIRGRTST